MYGPQPSDDVPLWQRQQQQRLATLRMEWKQIRIPKRTVSRGHRARAAQIYTLEALRHPDQAAQDWIVVRHDAITAMHNPMTEDLGSWALLEWGSTEMYELCEKCKDFVGEG